MNGDLHLESIIVTSKKGDANALRLEVTWDGEQYVITIVSGDEARVEKAIEIFEVSQYLRLADDPEGRPRFTDEVADLDRVLDDLIWDFGEDLPLRPPRLIYYTGLGTSGDELVVIVDIKGRVLTAWRTDELEMTAYEKAREALGDVPYFRLTRINNTDSIMTLVGVLADDAPPARDERA